MLELNDIRVNYGAIAALHGVTLRVPKGKIVTLIGANGAGKSTTLRAVSGLVNVRSGSIIFGGAPITNLPPHHIAALGIAHVPEGRMIFSNLTVMENLRMGAYLRKDKGNFPGDMDYIFSLFPRLGERLRQSAGTLSGGEQQMLAIGRALMSKPKCLILDEPSLGIAPILVQAIFEKIVEINRTTGVTTLLVEQNASIALEISHYGYVLETGKITLQNESTALLKNSEVRTAYLGAE